MTVSPPSGQPASASLLPPDFLIVGAGKSGTTWLSRNLAAIPGIYMVPQETHYFTKLSGQMDEKLDWYRQWFAKAQAGDLLGEKSSTYLHDPDAPVLIHKHLPDAKLIALVRDPIDRAYSQYCMQHRKGVADEDVRRAFDPDVAKPSRLLTESLYIEDLETYWALFPETHLKVLVYEQIRSAPDALLDEVCSFLGVSGTPDPQRLSRLVNAGRPVRLDPVLSKPLRRYPQLRRMGHRLLGPSLAQRIRSQFVRPIEYPVLPSDIRSVLRDYFRPSVEALSARTGLDLDHWLQGD